MKERNPFEVLRESIALPAMASRLAAIVYASNSYKTATALCETLDEASPGRKGYAALLEHDALCSSFEWTYTHGRLRRFAALYLEQRGVGLT